MRHGSAARRNPVLRGLPASASRELGGSPSGAGTPAGRSRTADVRPINDQPEEAPTIPWPTFLHLVRAKLMAEAVDNDVYRYALSPQQLAVSRTALDNFSGTLSSYLDKCEMLGDGKTQYKGDVHGQAAQVEANICYVQQHFTAQGEMLELLPMIDVLSGYLQASKTFRNI